MGVILKSYSLIDKKNSGNDSNNLLYEYAELLKKSGWTEAMLEGGVESPDGSTLFVVSRNPYKGQLLSLSQSLISSYSDIVGKLIDSGDFVER